MIKLAILLVLILVAIILIIAAMKPGTYRVQRSIDIAATPDKVFPLINDFHHWDGWSPWEKLDATMKKTHTGAAHGKGAIYEWQGNKKVGQGRMEITDSSAPGKVGIKLDFIKPFASSCTTLFTLDAVGGGTRVTWDMTGPALFITKIMQVFMSMDKMIGKDFEAGLASMKGLAERK